MHTTRSLRATFRHAIATAMLWTPGLVAGCDREPGPGIEDDPNFVPVRCEGETVLWLSDLMPDRPVDFLGLATAGIGSLATDAGAGGVAYDETSGERCLTASNVQECLAALGGLPGPQGQSFTLVAYADHSDRAVLHGTRGDEVFAIVSPEALTTFLGEVNNAQEAALLVQASGAANVPCEGGGARTAQDGFQVQGFLPVGCGGRDRILVAVSRDGAALQEISRERLRDPEPNCVVGRRPPGLRAPQRAPCRSAGAYLARAATLEAASVAAFLRLASELKAHGAPQRLVAAARGAARDEVRHARVTARLARRLGAEPERPRIEPTAPRELEEIALENAREGCVRETFGALAGRWQAQNAAEPSVRRAFARIAEDELRHAALAWRVAAWSEARVGANARRRVTGARRDAIAELQRELAIEPASDVRLRCGVPGARTAQVLFRCLSRAIG